MIRKVLLVVTVAAVGGAAALAVASREEIARYRAISRM